MRKNVIICISQLYSPQNHHHSITSFPNLTLRYVRMFLIMKKREANGRHSSYLPYMQNLIIFMCHIFTRRCSRTYVESVSLNKNKSTQQLHSVDFCL